VRLTARRGPPAPGVVRLDSARAPAGADRASAKEAITVATSATRISEVDFVGMPTRDLDAAVRFYGDTLGLRRSVHVPERHYAEFETDNLTVSVYDPGKMGMEHNRNPNPIALRVDDVAAARQELEAKGVEFHADTLDTGVCHMAFFADADGNALMLHRRYAPRQTES
jgi:predicted enzyme related to lactoylglutathione lyase